MIIKMSKSKPELCALYAIIKIKTRYVIQDNTYLFFLRVNTDRMSAKDNIFLLRVNTGKMSVKEHKTHLVHGLSHLGMHDDA